MASYSRFGIGILGHRKSIGSKKKEEEEDEGVEDDNGGGHTGAKLDFLRMCFKYLRMHILGFNI